LGRDVCYSIPSTGNPQYNLPSKFIAYINAVGPGEWFTLQAYVFVTGKGLHDLPDPLGLHVDQCAVARDQRQRAVLLPGLADVVRAMAAIPNVVE
jgi:hypothetical protein